MGLDYEIRYRKGTDNVVADALSRKHENSKECHGLSVTQPKWVEEIVESYNNDLVVQQLIEQLCLDAAAVPDTTYQQGILRKNGQVWVGSNGHLRERLIEEMHATPWGGRSGILSNQQRLRSIFYWP